MFPMHTPMHTFHSQIFPKCHTLTLISAPTWHTVNRDIVTSSTGFTPWIYTAPHCFSIILGLKEVLLQPTSTASREGTFPCMHTNFPCYNFVILTELDEVPKWLDYMLSITWGRQWKIGKEPKDLTITFPLSLILWDHVNKFISLVYGCWLY